MEDGRGKTGSCRGTYEEGDDNRVTFKWTSGCFGDWEMTYSVEGDVVTWSDQEALPPYDDGRGAEGRRGVQQPAVDARRRRIVSGNDEGVDMKPTHGRRDARRSTRRRGRCRRFRRKEPSRRRVVLGELRVLGRLRRIRRFDFEVEVEGDLKVRVTDVMAADGELLQTIFHIVFKETNTNSVSGKSLQLHRAANEVWDYASNTRTITGAVFVGNSPGGKWVQDTGRITMTLDTRIALFVAARTRRSSQAASTSSPAPRSPKPET